MAEETRITYVPLKGATLDYRGTKANSPDLPVLMAMDNFYSSPSTQLPTLRGALAKKIDLFSIETAEADADWVNSIVAQDNAYTQTFIARLAPMAYGDSLASSLRCESFSYSLSNSAGGSIVTKTSGDPFLGKVYPGDFIKFSDDSLYYTIKYVHSNDTLETVSNITGAHAPDAATIYHTHCFQRAQWPVSYDKFGDVHIYLPVDPTGSSSVERMRPPLQRTADSELDTITTTTISGTPTSYQFYPISGITVQAPKLNHIIKGTATGELYGSCGSWNWNNPNRGYFQQYRSVDGGVSWVRSPIPSIMIGIGLSYDASNSRVVSPNTGIRGINPFASGIYNGHSEWIGFAINTTTGTSYDIVYISEEHSIEPNITCSLIDGTNYCFLGNNRIGNTRKAVCYNIAISGLYESGMVWNGNTGNGINRATQVELPGSSVKAAVWDGATAIAVGENGSIATSPDLTTWTEQNGGNQTYILETVCNNSTSGYVAAGTNGTIISSADAATWSAETSGVTVNLHGSCYGNSLYVVVGDAGTILTSPDMAAWTSQTSGTTATLNSVVWDGANFVAVSSDTSIVLLSADGVTWTDTVGTGPGNVTGIVNGGTTKPEAVTETGGTAAYYSGSGYTYSKWPSAAAQSDANDVAYANSLYVAVGDGGVICTSTDGVVWTSQTSGVVTDLFGVCWDATNSKWIAVGAATILSSADAITWSDDSALIPATLTTPTFYRVRYISETTTVVAVGEDTTDTLPITISSPDAAAWTHELCYGALGGVYKDIDYNSVTSEYVWVGQHGSDAFFKYSAQLSYEELSKESDSIASLSLTGLAHSNSDYGSVYVSWTHPISPATDGTFEVFSDAARTVLVANGTGPIDSDIALSEVGASGLSGTVNIAADVVADFTAQPITTYYGVDVSNIINSASSTCFTGVWCDASRIVISGTNGACGFMATDYSSSANLGLGGSWYCVVGIDGLYWFGGTSRLVRVQIGNLSTVTTSEFITWSDLSSYPCNCFMILDGYVVECGTRELESGEWKYYPRRLRWTVPGTYSDFTGFGSGAQNFPGFGDFLTCAVLEHAGVIFEANGISVVTHTGNFDPELGPIWEYRQIKQGLTTISNIIKQEGQIFFVGNTGLLYSTNGVDVQELGSPFDLSRFTEFPPSTPVQMVFSPAARQLQIHQQSSLEDGSDLDVKVYCVNIDTGACSTWSTTSPGLRFSLVQLLGAGEPSWP